MLTLYIENSCSKDSACDCIVCVSCADYLLFTPDVYASTYGQNQQRRRQANKAKQWKYYNVKMCVHNTCVCLVANTTNSPSRVVIAACSVDRTTINLQLYFFAVHPNCFAYI